MKAERWKSVERIFDEADTLPITERHAFLDRACGEDLELRREVESLLLGADRGGDTLGAKVEESLRQALRLGPASPESFIGSDVGAYRIVGELGRGGMGVVFRATHREFGRQVAVKFVHGWLFAKDVKERFETERRILANLDHPSIARFIDAGSTPDGAPYLVMEYVEGQAIVAYCADRNKSIRERVRLIQQVCSAVQHAHRSLVIHRDLKPSNILVASDGSPKLLDFGIAKLMTEHLEAAAPLTREGARVLTPEYASPEQQRGEPLTTQTDVYSLGAVLYELLAGMPPHARVSPAWPNITNGSAKEPPPPSLAAPDPRGLRGDLDNIVLKAMHSDLRRRYGSAEELGEDLGRYLARRPVRARKDTVFYRARRFVGRHQAAVGLSIGIVVVSAGLVLSQIRARREELVSMNVSTFMQAHLRGALRERGSKVHTTEVMEWDDRSRTEAPSQQVSVANTVASVLEKSLILQRRWRGEDHPMVLNVLITLARLQHERGEFDEAERLYRENLALRRRQGGAGSHEVVLALGKLAEVLHDRGHLTRAEPVYREAVALSRGTLGPRHLTTAVVMSNLAGLLEDRDRFDEAESLCRESLAIRRDLFGANHVHVARGLHNLGLTLLARGNTTEARSSFDEALDIRKRVVPPDPVLIAESLSALGAAAAQARDFASAKRHYREAVDLLQSALAFGHPATAEAMIGLGEALLDGGAARAAEPVLRDGLTMLRIGPRARGADHARAEVALGGVLIALGARDEGRTLQSEGVDRLLLRFGENHPATRAARARVARGPLLLERGRDREHAGS